MMSEAWKDIPDYETFYQVSSLGRVRSLDRVSKKRNGKTFRIIGRILKIHNGNAILCKNYGQQAMSISVLVAEAFGVNAWLKIPVDTMHMTSVEEKLRLYILDIEK